MQRYAATTDLRFRTVKLATLRSPPLLTVIVSAARAVDRRTVLREPTFGGACTRDMRTPLVVIAVAALLGPAASTAAAKEIASVKVCGADGCTDVTDHTSMAIADGGPPTAWPDAKTPFYRVKIAVKGEDGQKVPGWSFQWVPAAQKIQFEDGTWGNPPSTTMDELNRVTRGIQPLPASKLVLPADVVADDLAAPAKSAPAPAKPASGPAHDDGMPAIVWVFLAAGALGVAALLARVAAGLLGRRGGSAAAG